MNCTDCREHFAAQAEHLLEPDMLVEQERHLALCAECREHLAATDALRHHLASMGELADGVSLANAVMRRIRVQNASRPAAAPITRLARWWIGAGAAAAAAVALLVTGLMIWPRDSQAQAAEVMLRGINATPRLATVHLQALMRTPPADNFSLISPQADFSSLELWREFDGQKRWRIEKPGRVAVMDGQTTLLYLRTSNAALKIPAAAPAAFDTQWLQFVADIEQTLTNGLAMAKKQGWKMSLTKATDAAGVVHQLVTIDVPSAVGPADYLYNKFLPTSATRRLYRFNDENGQLEALQIFVQAKDEFVLVFDVTRIDYNRPLAADVFSLALPANVAWLEPQQTGAPAAVPVDAKYAAMTAEQAARTFFEAFAQRNWEEVGVFLPIPLNDRTKAALGGLTVINIGDSFASAASAARFVPYEIQLSNGTTKKHNLALKKDPRTGGWRVDGGL